MQKEVCKLVGRKAKFKGKKKNWRRDQTLYWQEQTIDRHSKEYQALLDRAFEELGKNTGFQKALRAAGDAVFTHNIGKNDPTQTVLTRKEFIERLNRLRADLKNV